MSTEPKVQIYLASLLELEAQCHQGSFTAFQAALHSGDAVAVTTTAEQRQRNTQAIAVHQKRLTWLHGQGFLNRSTQTWEKLLNPKKENRLDLYCVTPRGAAEV